MPPVPQACQPLADEVAAFEAQEQQLRAQIPTLVGAAAWTALANLGQIRQQLDAARVALAECVHQNTAALQATLAVIDVGAASAAPVRIAGLWEMTPGGGGAVQREVSNVTGDSFAFTGPVPASFGLTVGTAGDPTLLGPDFRSLALSAASLPTDGPLGVEVVLCPSVRLEQSDFARLAAASTPTTSPVFGGSSPLATQASLYVPQVAATLSDAGIIVHTSGLMTVSTLGIPEAGGFVASTTLRAVPTTVPGVMDPVDLVTVSDLQVSLATGMGDAAVPLVRGYLTDLLTGQLRAFLRAELPAAVSKTFLLAALPPDVVVSVRNLSIDAAALQFQPVLGALGTTLSTFTPPAISPA
jgi:hypothetical protein